MFSHLSSSIIPSTRRAPLLSSVGFWLQATTPDHGWVCSAFYFCTFACRLPDKKERFGSTSSRTRLQKTRAPCPSTAELASQICAHAGLLARNFSPSSNVMIPASSLLILRASHCSTTAALACARVKRAVCAVKSAIMAISYTGFFITASCNSQSSHGQYTRSRTKQL
jgi:hypothetical protein